MNNLPKTMNRKRKMAKGNWGPEAHQRGVEHAKSIFKLHGLKAIRKLARYRPQNDYERGKIETAHQILESDQRTAIKEELGREPSSKELEISRRSIDEAMG